MIDGHGGNVYGLARRLGCRVSDIVDMSSNINPLGTVPGLKSALSSRIDSLQRLPEVDGRLAIDSLAAFLKIAPQTILAGNGTTQFIYAAGAALQSRRVLIVGPTYADYADACRAQAIVPDYFLCRKEDGFEPDLDRLDQTLPGYDTVFLCNPNNPTAGLVMPDPLQKLIARHPRVRFVVDESYLPFVPQAERLSLTGAGHSNLIVLWSASKIFGIPGLRCGFLIATTQLRNCFEQYMQPWCLNSLAQEAMVYLGANLPEVEGFVQKTRQYLVAERGHFVRRMRHCPSLTLYPSVTSYILMRLPSGQDAGKVCDKLAQKRLLIRNCSNFEGLSRRFIRVALKSPEVNRTAADLIQSTINPSAEKTGRQ